MYKNYEKTLQRLGISSYKVAKQTGVSQAVLSAWKQGISTPKIDKMQKIADYLGVEVNFLYDNIEPFTTDTITKEISLEEATNVFIEHFASPQEIENMSKKDKNEFKKYLLEQAELAFLKYKARR